MSIFFKKILIVDMKFPSIGSFTDTCRNIQGAPRWAYTLLDFMYLTVKIIKSLPSLGFHSDEDTDNIKHVKHEVLQIK